MASVLYTVCGLRVVSGWRPEDWPGFSTWTSTDQVRDSDMAVDWAQNDAKGDLSDENPPAMCVDLALACVHLGHIPAVGRLAVATDPVTDRQREIEEDRAAGDPLIQFTVCGIDRHTWQTVCCVGEARSWMLAWLDACDLAEAEGAKLLTARVHEGEHPPVEGFPFADRLAADEAGMRYTVTETWGVRWIE